MKSLILLLMISPSLSFCQSNYIIEDLNKEGNVQAFKMNLSKKFDVTGGTITGRMCVASSITIIGAGHALIFPDGTQQTTAGVGESTITVTAGQFTGNGSASSPLALVTSSVTLQGNTFNGNSQLVKTNSSGLGPISITGNAATATNVPASGVDLSTVTTHILTMIPSTATGSYPLNAATATKVPASGVDLSTVTANHTLKAGDTMTGNLIVGASVQANLFVGNGSLLTNTPTNAFVGTDMLPVGTFIQYGSTTAPRTFLYCNGTNYSTTTYSALFDVIGYAYGGSGANFTCDFRGMFARGLDTTGTIDSEIRVIGSSETDTFQGHNTTIVDPTHRHTESGHSSFGVAGGVNDVGVQAGANTGYAATGITATTPITDGTNGTPRISIETRPENIAVAVMVKYTMYGSTTSVNLLDSTNTWTAPQTVDIVGNATTATTAVSVPQSGVNLSTVTTHILTMIPSTATGSYPLSITGNATTATTVPQAGVNLSTVTTHILTMIPSTATGSYPLSITGTVPAASVSAGNLGGQVIASSITLTAMYGSPTLTGTNFTSIPNAALVTAVIPSSATGNYLLRAATATYLATAPGDCTAGQYISGLTAEGTKTCGTPSGAGDVVLAATQTFTGGNTFVQSSTFSGTINLPARDKIVFGNELANSSSTILSARYTTTQRSGLACVTGSTITFTTSASSRLLISYNGSNYNDTPTGSTDFLTYRLDGASPTLSAVRNYATVPHAMNGFNIITEQVAAGTHTLCLVTWSDVGTFQILGDIVLTKFWVMELR